MSNAPSSSLSRRPLVQAILATALAASGFVYGCSSGSSTDNGSTSPGDSSSNEELKAQASTALASPGTTYETIPSTLKGVATWTFSASSANGQVITGKDSAGATKAELAVLANANGAPSADAYAVSDSLGIDGDALVAAVQKDIDAADASGTSGTMSFRPFDLVTATDGGLIKPCNQLLREVLGTAIGVAGSGVGFAVALTCPEPFGAGCVAGMAITAGSVDKGYDVASSCPTAPAAAPTATATPVPTATACTPSTCPGM